MLTNSQPHVKESKALSWAARLVAVTVESMLGVVLMITLFTIPLAKYPPSHTVQEVINYDQGMVLAIFVVAMLLGYFAHILVSTIVDAGSWIGAKLHKQN